MFQELEEENWTYFDTQIGQRQAYPNAASQGLTVFETKDAAAAKQEINSIVDEILNFKGA